MLGKCRACDIAQIYPCEMEVVRNDWCITDSVDGFLLYFISKVYLILLHAVFQSTLGHYLAFPYFERPY